MVVAVVVEVQGADDFGLKRDHDVVRVLQAFTEVLPRVLLHLDVVELPADEKTKIIRM